MRGIWLLVVALLLAPLAPALGQDEAEAPDADLGADLPVGISVRLGFTEKVPGTGFTPVVVDLSARERDHDEVTVVFQPADSAVPLLRLGPVSLKALRTRRVRGIASAKTWLGAVKLVVNVEGPGGEVLGRTVVFPDSTSEHLLLVIDKHRAAPTDFSQLQTLRGKNRSGLRWTTSIVSNVEDLPASSLGYTGVSAVLLGDLELERWGEAQAHALAGWLAQGGYLIVSLGRRGALLRQSLLGRCLGEALAPVPFDRQPIPGSQVSLRTLLANFGPVDALETTRPPYSTPLHPGENDDVMFRDDARPRGRPFVVTRRHGRGRIFLIAADLWSPPFLHAPHTRQLIERVLLAGTRHRPRTNYIFHELAAIRQPAQVGPAFAVLILYALIAGPGVYFLLRAKNRGILLWIVIPTLTLGFTALVPFYRLVLRDAESTLVGVRLIEIAKGSKLAVETVDTLVFSGSLEPKTLSLNGDDAVAYAVIPPRRMKRRRSPRLGAVLGTAGPGGLNFELPIALWGTRYISFNRTTEAPRISGLIEASVMAAPGDTIAKLKIDYEAGLTLRGAVVIYPSRAGPLVHVLDKNLSSGDTYEKELKGFIRAGGYEPKDKGLASLMISTLMDKPYKDLVEARWEAFLIGWLNAPFPVQATPNVRARASATIVVVSLRVRFRDGVPYGRMSPSEEASTIAVVDTSTITREVETRFTLPKSRDAEVTVVSLRLRATVGGIIRPSKLKISGDYREDDGTTSRRPISIEGENTRRSDSGRSVRVELPDPAQWISEGGELIIYQRFDRPKLDEDQGYKVRLDANAAWSPE